MRGSKCLQPQNLQLLFADLDKSSHYIQGSPKGERRSLLANWSQPLQPKLDALPESASQQWAGSPFSWIPDSSSCGSAGNAARRRDFADAETFGRCGFPSFNKVINIESLELGVFLCYSSCKASEGCSLGLTTDSVLPSILSETNSNDTPQQLEPVTGRVEKSMWTSYCLSFPALVWRPLASASVFTLSTALPISRLRNPESLIFPSSPFTSSSTLSAQSVFLSFSRVM